MSVNIVSNFLNEIGLKDPVPCCSLSNANLYTEALALFNSRFTWALVSFFLGIYPPCESQKRWIISAVDGSCVLYFDNCIGW